MRDDIERRLTWQVTSEFGLMQTHGRAGRATGTALIVSVVNQRPHDLFFYGRPAEMLRGKVDPPGCWLDASAVLVRQYRLGLRFWYLACTPRFKMRQCNA
ncbi:MAG TPA: hypothetical protein P5307_25375 [Pirellulaceae bacterium]|nr:hypothetical protein [Planctomycetales bacterium]MCB9941263.1 hypothetical protein [Planctomycetaceae bacterium]HRX82432.1 hypothetical protein [Pirellulaceae bacterium]